MTRIFNNRIIVFIATALTLGIIVSAYYARTYLLFYLLASLLLIAFILTFFIKPLKKYKIQFLVLFLVFIFGFGYTRYKISLYEKEAVWNGQTVTVTGTVSDIYTYPSGSKIVTLTGVKIDGVKTYGKITFYTDEEDLLLGNILSVTGEIEYKEYSVYRFSNKNNLTINDETVVILQEPKNIFYVVGNYLKNNILNNVSGDEGGIMVALTLGDTSYIDSSTLKNYRLSGISHIFAVSGLHIVFFTTMISTVLSLLKLKGIKNTLISCCLSILYAGICGFPVSAIRAVIMSACLNFVKNAGRKYDFLNSIFLSLIVVLLIFPETLFTYGLILSFSAVIGIALFSKIFEWVFSFLSDSFASSLGVSCAVTYFMTPILFLAWGYSSVIVIFLNVLLVPIVSVLYTLVFSVSIIYAILPFVGFLWKLPYVVAYFINSVLEELNVVLFTVYGKISVVSVILYYICAFIVCDRTNFKRPVKLIFGGISLIILILAVWGVF